MIELDLQSLGTDPVELRGRFSASGEGWKDAEVDFAEDPAYELRAAFTGERDVHVRGRMEAVVLLDCRRCLSGMKRSVEVELDLLFDPDVGEDAGQEQVYPLEAEAGVLELFPVLREQLLLEVPRFPLCREECAGLCPECGVDRNEETCDCVLDEPDPRWDALRELQADDTQE